MSTTPWGWRVELDRVWDVLGPFPIHAREQHFLSPAYPLDLSLPISTTTQYPTSLTHSAYTSWSKTTADPHGTILVSHPSVPWEQIRATEGWAALQHLNVLRGWLSLYPLSNTSANVPEPLLRTELLQGAFFTILPPPDSPERRTHVPEWHYGNIYTLERAPVQLVRLPVSPAKDMVRTKYEVIICAPYEIRLFGDPSAYSSPHPVLTLNFSVSLHSPWSPTLSSETDGMQAGDDAPLQHMPAHSIIPHIVDGTPFGDALGIGIQSLDLGRRSGNGQRYWSVVRACLAPGSVHLPPSLSLELLGGVPVRIIPTQTRIIPLLLRLSSLERIPDSVKQLDVELTCVSWSATQSASNQSASHTFGDADPTVQSPFALRATLPLTHVPLWTQEQHIPVHASYFFADSMPGVFLVKPPKMAFGDSQIVPGKHGKIDISKCRGNEPVLALHGAGADILTQSFWPDSLLRQKYAWVVMPQGRTAWGLDWHGPSAGDAFGAVSALSRILANGRWSKWGFEPDTRIILMGHSNGGQGAWYMASRWPDRVCAVVPAAGYIKSQAYVSWSMSRSAHFVDPELRAVLDSSLTPDDNDLFLGNLVGKPVLALHGGADDNVPPWHTREQVGILKTWEPSADVTYHEDPGRPHWYFEVLYNEHVQAFLDRVYFSSPPSRSVGPTTPVQGAPVNPESNFTLTVAIPAESGSLNGWQIHALTTPGLLGRLRVTTTQEGHVSVRTTNVSVFSLHVKLWITARCCTNEATVLTIDNRDILIDLIDSDDTVFLFAKEANAAEPHRPSWKILPPPSPTHSLCVPFQRLQSILSTAAPLTLLVPTPQPSPELSAALRIAYALQLFHAIDVQIVSVPELETGVSTRPVINKGNLIVIGCAETPLVRKWLKRPGGLWTYADGTWSLAATRFDGPSLAILFSHPHPEDDSGSRLALFLQSTDPSGLERAVRLFPVRTGVLSPDWLVVDGRADTIGTAGVQGAGVYGWKLSNAGDQPVSGQWIWNERMSWLD